MKIKEMETEKLISLLCGDQFMNTKALPEYDILSLEMSDGPMDKAAMRWRQIEKFLETHPYIMNADVRALCNVSAATANRILTGLSTEGKLVRYREGGHWAYKLKE